MPERRSTDFTKDGKCSGCGACCSNILPLTEKEIKTLRKFVRKKHIKPAMHAPVILSGLSYDCICPFRDETLKICTCYEVRPFVCRYYDCHLDATDSLPKIRGKEDYVLSNVRAAIFDLPEELSIADWIILMDNLESKKRN